LGGLDLLPLEKVISKGQIASLFASLDLLLQSDRYSASNPSIWSKAIMNLKSMSIDALIGLRGKIDAVLTAKVQDERRSLESELAKLSRVDMGSGRTKASFGRGVRGKVAPKYRNPENPAETWAGRGLKPRWLAAALKSGKKLDDFMIGGAVKDGAKAVKRKVRVKRK
jgi:DNA-binding protein H-NS